MRKVVAKTADDDLEEGRRARHVPKAMLSERIGRDVDCVRDGHRAEHLTSPRRRHHAGREVHHGPEVVPRAFLRGSKVQTHAHLETVGKPTPRLVVQVGLSRDRRRDRGMGRWKGRSDTVPSGREHVPARGLDRGAQELVVSRQGDLHRRRVLGPQPRRALHVGEQEAHLARGLLDHRASLARSGRLPGFGLPDKP